MSAAPAGPEELAAHITRYTALPDAARPAVLQLALRLLALRGAVPAGHSLLVGGSLARGEPAIIPRNGGWELASDVDLLLVHTTPLPGLSADQMTARARGGLPTATAMTASADEYRRLGTCLGREFKRGVILAGRPPASDPVGLDARDAYELLLYGVQAWFWDGLATAWEVGDDPGLDVKVNRVCLKALRACVMLGGGECCSDVPAAPAPMRDQLRAELVWRADPRATPLDPSRFWPLVADALAVFDRRVGARSDAITGTAYEHRPGAAAVAEQQRLAHALARLVCAPLPDGLGDAAAVVAAQRTAWGNLVQRGLARSAHSPEEHFAHRAQAIREDMLRFKTAPDFGLSTRWP